MSAQGRASSKAADALSTRSSLPHLAAIITPIGRPLEPSPHGTDATGYPVRFQNTWKGMKVVQWGRTDFPPISEGCSPTGKAVTAFVGVMSRS